MTVDLIHDTVGRNWVKSQISNAVVNGVTGPQGPPGPVGPTGVQGATGASGSAGPNTVSGTTSSTLGTGIVKSGSSVLSLAIAGTDYVSPSGLTTALSSYLTTATATSTYVPYSGANTNVNLGSKALTTTGNIQGYALSAKGAYNPGWGVPINTTNLALYSSVYDDNQGNGKLYIFAQQPGNYWNFMSADSSGNPVARMTFGDPADGTVTFSSIYWQNCVFIIGGTGGGFGNAYIRITLNTGQGTECGDGFGMTTNVAQGQFTVNTGFFDSSSQNTNGYDSSGLIFGVYDTNGNFALQVCQADGGIGDYVRSYHNVLDDGSGNGNFLGTLTAASHSTAGATSSQFVKGDGSLDSSTYLPYKSKGTITLVSGTKALTITGITTSNQAFITLTTPGGTLGAAYKAVCTTNTLTVTAVTVAGVTVATDTSTLNYLII